MKWSLSSAGRASALQAGGHRFEPVPGRHFFYIWLHSSVGRAEDWKSLCHWFNSSWSHQICKSVKCWKINILQIIFCFWMQFDCNPVIRQILHFWTSLSWSDPKLLNFLSNNLGSLQLKLVFFTYFLLPLKLPIFHIDM